MGQQKFITHPRKGKHLNRDERIQMEGLLNAKRVPSEIAALLGRDVRTLEREIKRGTVERMHTDLSRSAACRAGRGQDVHDLNATAKGRDISTFSRERIWQIEELDQPVSPEDTSVSNRRRKVHH